MACLCSRKVIQRTTLRSRSNVSRTHDEKEPFLAVIASSSQNCQAGVRLANHSARAGNTCTRPLIFEKAINARLARAKAFQPSQ